MKFSPTVRFTFFCLFGIACASGGIVLAQVSDMDGDFIADAIDNCLNAYNPSQLDSDGDAIGDACDPDLMGLDSQPLQREGAVFYNVDFGTPPHTVGQPPALGAGSLPRDRPTDIVFGTPMVVASLGDLSNQPLLFDRDGASGQSGLLYEQVWFDMPSEDSSLPRFPRYHIQMDVMFETIGSHTGDERLAAIHIDVPSAHQIRFDSNGQIIAQVLGSGGYEVPIGTVQLGVPLFLEIDVDLVLQTWVIRIDGTQRLSNFLPSPFSSFRFVRVNLAAQIAPEARFGIDNVRIEGLSEDANGACCDRRIADPNARCVDDVPESQCVIDDPVQQTWTKARSCSEVSCGEHTGACCDRRTADPSARCVDDVPESQCPVDDPAQQSWTKATSCSEVSCAEHTGACCDRRIADPDERCVDDVPQSQCPIEDPMQQSWTKATSCSEVACAEHTGACCDRRIADPDARCMDNIPESLCVIDDPVQISWTKSTSCSEVSCPEHTGACCRVLEGECAEDVTESACQGPDFSWTKGASCSLVNCEALEGACCDNTGAGMCGDAVTIHECGCENCVFTVGAACYLDGHECNPISPLIPTVSAWGLLILALVHLCIAKITFGRWENRPIKYV